MSLTITKALIPAAGKGTRFLPATKVVPKELLPIINTPMIHYVVEEVYQSELKELLLVISPGKESLLNYFKPNKDLENFLKVKNGLSSYENIFSWLEKIQVEIVIQKEQLGLGHAVLCAEQEFKNESFAVLLGDEIMLGERPVTKQLIEIAQQFEASVVGVMPILPQDTNKYGVIAGGPFSQIPKTYKMTHMVEKPSPQDAPSLLATPGRYVFTSAIFDYLKNIKKGAQGEYQLTDAISLMASEKIVLAHEFQGERFDTGNISSYLEALLEFSLRDPQYKSHMINLMKKKLEKYE